MSKKRNIRKLIYLLLTLFLLVVAVLSGRLTLSAFAEADTYSDVLTDLRKDSSFDLNDYTDRLQDFPNRADYYKVEVIQIAESTDGELFVYTYQPCQKSLKLTATEINMSLSESADGTQLYSLVYLNSRDVFAKYKVDGFKVKADTARYYNISSIYRDFIKDIDKEADNGNTTNKKAYAVGQCWKAITQDGNVTYEMLNVEVVEIINPFTSFIRRNKNQSANGYYQDNYYVAFSTKRNIESLLSASVAYRIQDYFYKENNVLGFDDTDFWNKSTFSNERRTKKDIHCNEVIELQQQGYDLFGIFDLNEKFSWNRIQSSDEFIANAGASSSDNEAVKKLQWVLMFDEVSMYRYQSSGLIARYEETGQIIDEVTILRLEFVEGGKTYNLGTVSDTVTGEHDFGGDDKNDDKDDEKQGFFAYIWNCIVKLFTGKASGWETFVAIFSIVVVFIIGVIIIKLVKWAIKGIFK